MESVRPSILHRKLRSSNISVETAEEQYKREQELLAAKSRRLSAAEARLLGSLYPDSEHIKARQQEILQMQEQHMAAQAAARQREAQLEQQLSRSRSGYQPDMSVRPWTAATLSYASEKDQREARKQFAAELAAENLALMASRAQQRQQQQRREVEQEAQALAREGDCYWNLGARSSRWIAPEHRHLAPAGSRSSRARATAAAVEPPWAVHAGSGRGASGGEAAAAAVSRLSLADERRVQQQPHQAMRHPWAWE